MTGHPIVRALVNGASHISVNIESEIASRSQAWSISPGWTRVRESG